MSRMVFSREKNHKYFIGFKDDDQKIKPLRIMLTKANAYVKRCDVENKWVSFRVEDYEL